MRKKSMATRFNWYIVLAVIFPLIISSLAISAYLLHRYSSEIHEKDQLHIKGLTHTVKGFIDHAFSLNYQLSINPIVIDSIIAAPGNWDERTAAYQERYRARKSLSSESGLPIFVEMQERYDFVELFFLQDEVGDQVARSFGSLGHRGSRWWFRKILEDPQRSPFWSKSYYSMTGNKPVASAFHPMFKNNRLIGVMGTDINFEKLQQVVEGFLDSKDLYAIVIDNEGVIIAHPEKEVLGQMYNLLQMTRNSLVTDEHGNAILNEAGYHKTQEEKIGSWASKVSGLVRKTLQGESGIEDSILISGEMSTIYYAPVQLPGGASARSNYGILLVREKSTINKTRIAICIFVFLFSLLTIGAITYLFRRYFSRTVLTPLHTLTSTMADVDFTAHQKVKIDSGDEFQLLAETYNVMRLQLARAGSELIELNQKLEARVGERTCELQESNQQLQEEIVKREKIDRELVQAKNSAESANEAKSEFLAKMSHEIRTPMNGIMGLTDLLLRTDDLPDQHNYLHMIKKSAGRLLHIINSILDFAKIGSGRLEVENISFNLRDSLNSTFDMLKVVAEDKGLQMTLDVSTDIPAYLIGDSAKLTQVLINLVANAIKFTPQGLIQIKAQVEEEMAGHIIIHFQVVDTGISIDANEISQIFKPFAQADSSHARQYGGTGLGLAICAELVGLMDGKIWVENNEGGAGSTFHFTTTFMLTGKQVGIQQNMDASVVDISLPENLHILLVDDEEINRIVAAENITQQGWRVTEVENGNQALAALDSDRFDLVLMDLEMPEMDGFETTERIRARESGGDEHVPVVAMTAHAMKGYKEQCLAAGMDDYLAKPFKVAELLEVISRNCFKGKG